MVYFEHWGDKVVYKLSMVMSDSDFLLCQHMKSNFKWCYSMVTTNMNDQSKHSLWGSNVKTRKVVLGGCRG